MPVRLSPTAHPPVPTDLAAMWFAPKATAALSPALADFVRGVRLLEEQDNAAAALPLVSAGALAKTPLADYARYYQGLALLELERFDAADTVFGELSAKAIAGHLPEDAAFRQGEVKEAKKDFKGAVAIYEALTNRILAQPQLAWLKLGLAADEAGLPMRSVTALQRVYYDYPTTAEADRAAAELDRQDVDTDAVLAPRELARADALFRTRRWTHAKNSYEQAKPFMTGADRMRVELRLAACEVALGRYREGRDALKPLLEGPLADEANFHYVNATRGLRQGDEHEKLARAYVDKFPGSAFADEVLNDLASKYIVDDEDGKAEAIFREIIERYPTGRFAERAAWKAGWWAYRAGRFDEAVRYFDGGSAQFPRSDYRPSWLYWSGRAAQQMGDVETGVARLRLAAIDYHNSYYGRLAVARLAGERGGAVAATLRREALPDVPAVPSARSHRAVARHRAEPRGDGRAAVRAADVGRLAAPAGDHGTDAPAVGQHPRRHQRDEARVSAIPRRRRRDAAARNSPGDLPGRTLAAAAEERGGARPRPVPGGRPRRCRSPISMRSSSRTPTPWG